MKPPSVVEKNRRSIVDTEARSAAERLGGCSTKEEER